MPDVSDSVPLREYFEARLTDADRFYTERFNDIEQATKLARESMGLRLDGMNEFRLALKDAQVNTPTRAELDAIADGLLADIEALQKSANIAEGKASQTSVILSAAISIVSLVLGVIGLLKG